MQRLMSATFLALLVASVSFADDKAERLIVEPIDGKPVTVKVGDTVRVQMGSIDGATFTAKVTGEGKLHTATVIKKDGKQPLIGVATKEYDLTVTKQGKVTLEVVAKTRAGAEKKVTQEITVE